MRALCTAFAGRFVNRFVACLVACLLVSLVAPVRAAEDAAHAKPPQTAADSTAEARALYKKATAHYAVGEYDAAAQAYEEAYKLRPNPALLYNVAQCYRLGGKADRALTIYRNYLRLYPDADHAAEVRAHIGKLEQQVAARTAPPPASTMPAAPPPAPMPPSPAPIPPPAAAAPTPTPAPTLALTPPPVTNELPLIAPVTTVAAPVAPSRPIYRRPWFWGAVGAVAVAGVVTVIAVSASSSNGQWANLPEVKQGALRAEGLRW